MAHRYANAARRRVCSQFNGAWQLWSERHKPRVPAGSLEEPVENSNIRSQQVLARLRSALGMRQKRPLQMNADRPRSGNAISVRSRNPLRMIDQPGEPFEC